MVFHTRSFEKLNKLISNYFYYHFSLQTSSRNRAFLLTIFLRKAPVKM
jgi:hypothetical protein